MVRNVHAGTNKIKLCELWKVYFWVLKCKGKICVIAFMQHNLLQGIAEQSIIFSNLCLTQGKNDPKSSIEVHSKICLKCLKFIKFPTGHFFSLYWHVFLGRFFTIFAKCVSIPSKSISIICGEGPSNVGEWVIKCGWSPLPALTQAGWAGSNSTMWDGIFWWAG